MSDLIDRQAAIDAIRASTSKYTGFMEMEMYTDDDAVEAIEAVPAASPWHRGEDELPKSGEFGEIVLACNDVGTVKAAYLLSNGKWYAANNTDWDAWTWMPNVTHWMPLPEPPKEDA